MEKPKPEVFHILYVKNENEKNEKNEKMEKFFSDFYFTIYVQGFLKVKIPFFIFRWLHQPKIGVTAANIYTFKVF